MATANKTQNFLPFGSNWKLKKIPMKASTEMEDGAAIGIEISSNTTTGNKTLMGTENAAGADFIGILAEPIASTDDDYATAGKLKAVRVPMNEQALARFTVVGGTFTAIDEGKTAKFDSTSLGVDVDTIGKGVRIEKFISSTRGTCSFVLPTTETA